MAAPNVEYESLQIYLRDRYADRVVLTFTEIESLIGLELPEAARSQQEWWDGSAARPSRQSATWTLADRSATLNR